jgi:hypothetical protein
MRIDERKQREELNIQRQIVTQTIMFKQKEKNEHIRLLIGLIHSFRLPLVIMIIMTVIIIRRLYCSTNVICSVGTESAVIILYVSNSTSSAVSDNLM